MASIHRSSISGDFDTTAAAEIPSAARARKPGTVAAWWFAIRPRTLTIAMAPVIVGSALAVASGAAFDLPVALIAFAAAILIQIGTNLQNDVGDFLRGADTPNRLGPPRATSQGWLSAREVRRGVQTAFGLALVLGAYLVWRGGWPLVLIGLASIVAGLAYTSGPRPIAYTGLGEIFVFVFFGLVAVCGSYYLQTHSIGATAIIAGAMIGSLAAAVLVVNNYRDIESDGSAGKRTLAVCIGERFTRVEYTLLLLTPFAVLPLARPVAASMLVGALPYAALPFALRLVYRVYAARRGAWLNRLLAETALLQLVFGVLLAASALIER